MWDGPGPRQGPRGGPPFRGDHRGEMFYGRDRPMQDFRGRDGMNMGPMSNMGPRHLDLPPMDMRRMDGPPVRGRDVDPRDMDPRDMDPRDMRGREPNRDFFRPGEEPDFSHRRHHDFPIRDRGFPGPGRNLADMGGRGMPPRDLNDRYMDMRERDRDSFHYDAPQYGDANLDGRRMFPPERDGGFRDMRDGPAMDMRDRPPMDIRDSERFDMDLPPRERRLLETDRRGGPPHNQRGGFDSDMDFRNRHGPSAEFRGRDRSPLRYGNDDAPPGDRGRSDMPPDVAGPKRSEFMGSDGKLEEREYPDQSDSPLMDYRCGEEMTLAEEWKNRKKDKNPFLTTGKGLGGLPEPSFPVGFGRDLTVRDQLPYQERDRPPVDFQGKETGFPHGGRFPPVDLPPIGSRPPHDRPLLESSPFPGRENQNKRWLGESDQKHSQSQLIYDERPPYHKEKNTPLHDIQVPTDGFKGLKDVPLGQDPSREKVRADCDIQSSTCQPRDQDYRDIDYRTGSTRTFEYNHEELQATGKPPKESDQVTPSEVSESGSQDQDYRSASLEGKVSNTISVTGIPKTATMEQILGAFAGRDGAPMPGIKIKNVVPGYSYDTAYVEFLNLEDAVHFMESNKGSLKIGTRSSSMTFFHPDEHDRGVHESDHKVPQLQETTLPRQDEPLEEMNGSKPKGPMDPLSNSQWQRSSDLTPEAWQQQVDQQLQQQEAEQQAESWGNRNHPSNMANKNRSVFKDSRTLIIKNVKPTTTVETILKALDPFAYLDERNVRLVKAKQPGARGFCFVDMDSHEQVIRLVELLTKPKPLYIDGVRVYAEVARPLKNQNFKKDNDQPNTSILGYPPETSMMGQQQQQQSQQFPQPPQYMIPPTGVPAGMQGDMLIGSSIPDMASNPSMGQGLGYSETPAVDPSYQAAVPHIAPEAAGVMVPVDGSQTYVYGSEVPDMSNYLYDSTSGFYYDPETTLYYDPGSRYFYNAQTQEYLYWDGMSKTYIPVPGGNSAAAQPLVMTAEDQAILSNPAADAPLEMKKPTVPPVTTTVPASAPAPAPEPVPAPASAATTPAVPAQEPVQTVTAPQEKKEDDESKKDKDSKEDKPRSLAAVKIMKDMERWAKIQNRQKESVRAASPVLKGGMDDDRRQSKSADAGFAIFERKIAGGEDLFKKPLAPPKKDEKSKRPMGSLGMLASDYAAGSDEEVEEDKEEASKGSQGSQPEDKDSKLTDWKKMACLLCRRQFPNKDALIRHQQLSDLHKQNMEIHLKIKRSKKELEALENQEKELNATESAQSPEQKRKKHRHIHHHRSGNWAGSSKESKAGERPGLGAEPAPQRKKKEHVVWDHATYKQAVRKAMFARFKELE